MGRKLEWELSGKSDVPEKMAKAKASMEGLEGAANALSKKFREAFKDIAVGFLAPMVIIQKAISFISDKIAEAKQNADDARAFAKEEESRGYMRAGGREALLQSEERSAEAKRKAKTQLAEKIGYESFLLEDPRGKKMLEEQSSAAARVAAKFLPGLPMGKEDQLRREFMASQAAQDPLVRQLIDSLLAADAEARAAKPEEVVKGALTAQKISEISGNVIGVGQSPQLDAMRQQIVLQEDMANSLRALVEADQRQSGFRPEKGFDLGGMGSAGRTTFPR